jgi:hypothetical protein
VFQCCQTIAAWLAGNGWVRAVALTVYYLAILVALVILYGLRNFTNPPFVYQGF